MPASVRFGIVEDRKVKTMTIGAFFLGLLIIIAGVISVKYNRQIADSFGDSGIANMIGPGNKYGVFKIYSVVAILIGLFIMFGLHEYFLNLIISPFTDRGIS